MKCQILFAQKNNVNIFQNVVYYSCDWCSCFSEKTNVNYFKMSSAAVLISALWVNIADNTGAFGIFSPAVEPPSRIKIPTR